LVTDAASVQDGHPEVRDIVFYDRRIYFCYVEQIKLTRGEDNFQVCFSQGRHAVEACDSRAQAWGD